MATGCPVQGEAVSCPVLAAGSSHTNGKSTALCRTGIPCAPALVYNQERDAAILGRGHVRRQVKRKGGHVKESLLGCMDGGALCEGRAPCQEREPLEDLGCG